MNDIILTGNFPIPSDFRAKWINALESGEYTKTKGRLCRILPNGNKSYCCLGIAEHICGTSDEIMNGFNVPMNLGNKSNSPEILKSSSSLCNLPGMLVCLNDVLDKPFLQIAEWLKENTFSSEIL